MGSVGEGIKLQILRIDLTTRKVRTEEKDEEFIRKFLGGRGVSRWLLLNETAKGTKPFDPGNMVIVSTGLLAGTEAPGSCRVQIDTMSPFNNGVASANGGGNFAPQLKFNGYDILIIEGKAPSPVYILIHNRSVEIVDANGVWGKTTWETEDLLRKKHGENISVMDIGPAGENLVSSAAVIIDKYRAAARCGIGAVIGSKNLKAIAVEGDNEVVPSDPERFSEKAREMTERIMNTDVGKGLNADGTPLWLQFTNALSWSPVRNFQDNYVAPEKVKTLFQENWKNIESKKIETCYNCSVECGFLRTVTDGPYKGTASANIEANAFWDFAYKLDIYDPAVVVKAQEICNRYGLDVDSVSGAISWAYECYEKGIINRDDTDGLELVWGNDESLMALLKKTAMRQGFGDLLAEGCKKASEKLGRGSQKYCLHVKGQDLKEPVRTLKGWALGVMVSPRAGTHTRGCPETEVMQMSPEDGEKYYGVATAGDQLSYEGKPELVVLNEHIHALCDSLGLCSLLSAWNGPELPGIDDYAELCSAFIGREISADELTETAERIVTLEKYFNQVHTIFERKDDYPPERLMTEPVMTGPLKGEKLEKDKWGGMLDEYYELHRWDRETGLISNECLKELGILLP